MSAPLFINQQTTEATDTESKETLLLFLCSCARTRRAWVSETSEATVPTGLPQGLAAVMPQVIFAFVTSAATGISTQRSDESLTAKRYESVLDILASDSNILSSYIALLQEKLDGA
jgi:hypothetical protein